MYKANLSHNQLEKYLSFLEVKSFISRTQDAPEGTPFFEITEKGIQFLSDYSRLSRFL
jgi:predicted transcriptional regulator